MSPRQKAFHNQWISKQSCKLSTSFIQSYESVQQMNRRSKPSKQAELIFLKKLRNLKKKIKYLTEAEQSQDEQFVIKRRFCSQIQSQQPSSSIIQQESSNKNLKRKGQNLRNSNLQQICQTNHDQSKFRKLFRVNEQSFHIQQLKLQNAVQQEEQIKQQKIDDQSYNENGLLIKYFIRYNEYSDRNSQ